MGKSAVGPSKRAHRRPLNDVLTAHIMIFFSIQPSITARVRIRRAVDLDVVSFLLHDGDARALAL